MLRFASLLLCWLLPGLCFGQTLKLPPEIITDSAAVVVQPEYDKSLKLVETKWVVLGLKKAPTFSYLEPPFVAKSKSAILIARPTDDDEVTIVAVALYEGGKLAQPAVTVLKAKPGGGAGGGTVPTTPTGPNPPAGDRDIPATGTGLAVILVVDPNNVTEDIKALGVGTNAISQALAQKNGKWYVRNNTDSLVADFKPSFDGKTLPVLLVIDTKTNPKRVIGASTLVPAGDVAATSRRIITQIANAVGP